MLLESANYINDMEKSKSKATQVTKSKSKNIKLQLNTQILIYLMQKKLSSLYFSLANRNYIKKI